MNKCYWVKEFFIINHETISYYVPHFYYGEDKTKTIEFHSFEELYDFAKITNRLDCEIRKNIFGREYIRFLDDYGFFNVSKKNFSSVTFARKFEEFKPTVEQAMKYLTVEQFKEYAGFTKEEIK